ncbi:rod shape-determining protein MreD [Qipengyuania sp. JC766]|uniref:rod shape-determining protein MreD n=1 Tax=Qipengyuania sp. JC766 TaxID=3232139 RepID=UPI0034580AE5
MIERVNTKARSDRYGSRLNRAHSPVIAYAVPVATILLGSFLPFFAIAGAAPYIPPFGFLMLLCWRSLQPGLFPIWIGFPLGLFDDLFSGQPFGSAILLWSLTMIAFEMIDTRFPWRSFWQDWMTVAMFTTLYIVLAAVVSGGELSVPGLVAIVPQIVFSIFAFPLLARIVASFDRFRLLRWRRLG